MNTQDTLSNLSIQRLTSCAEDLITLITEASKIFPLVVLEGHRDEAAQTKAFETGHSKQEWPHSKHNTLPSQAVDIAPKPYDPNDNVRIVLLAGVVLDEAARLGIKVRWGGDWNQNWNPTDEKFRDLYHFEVL